MGKTIRENEEVKIVYLNCHHLNKVRTDREKTFSAEILTSKHCILKNKSLNIRLTP